MMDDVQLKIEKYRIQTLKNLSREKFEDILEPTFQKRKLTWCHRTLLWLESAATARNLVILTLVLALCVFKLYPYLKYVLITFDRYYYGFFNERMPILALTTPHKTYYAEKGVPFINI